jgi:hypothetical protein
MSTNNTIDIVSSVPHDVTNLILDYLSAKELASAGKVCKNWNAHTSLDAIWKKFVKSYDIYIPKDNSKPLKQLVIEQIKTAFTTDETLYAKIDKFVGTNIKNGFGFALEYRSHSKPDSAFSYYFVNMSCEHETKAACEESFSKVPIKQKIIGKDSADFAVTNASNSDLNFVSDSTEYPTKNGYLGTSFGAVQGGKLLQADCNVDPKAKTKIFLSITKHMH